MHWMIGVFRTYLDHAQCCITLQWVSLVVWWASDRSIDVPVADPSPSCSDVKEPKASLLSTSLIHQGSVVAR